MALVKLDSHIGQPQRYTCLSSDTKPDGATQEGLEAGAVLWETDTGMRFWWDGASWQHGLITIPVEHQRIHNGQAFMASNFWSSVANGAVAEMLVQAAVGMHTLYEVSSGGDSEVEIFENPTYSSEGTVVNHGNHNRFSTNASASVITHTPTLTADGTSIPGGARLVPGGTGGNAGGGSDGGFSREVILKSGNDYLIRATNRAGVAKAISISLDWYQYTTT